MNKSHQPIYARDDDPNKANNMSASMPPAKRKFFRQTWIMALSLFLISAVSGFLFLDKTSWIDSDGFLHEPLFWTIPISCFFLLVAIVSALLDINHS